MTEEMAKVDSSDVLFKIRQDSHNFHTSISCSAVDDGYISICNRIE